MRYPRSEAVGPVVEQDGVVCGVGEGDGGVVGEGWGLGGERFPEETVGYYVRGDSAVGAFDVVGPGEVFAEVGGEAFEGFEGVGCCEGLGLER